MRRWIEIVYLLWWAWLCMALLHELGHIAVGCAVGGDLEHFELRPWCLPHSLFASNSFPLLTLWAGPILGSVSVLVVAAIVRRQAVWFVAWFSVVANGLYLLAGYYSGDSELDSTKMLQEGTPAWMLIAVGAAMSIAGYIGFRSEFQRAVSGNASPLSLRSIVISAGAMVILVLLLAVMGSR
ncbi:hypothetical protein [Planctomycetes bacterium K23_9]|uniref:Peptidase family M50 n=1 Tax=Stieleria marina TaxID=1930275 RepID=A0A517NZ68_9BACT|nr:hypothetical protein K239x_44290 [Planctomycetes bacterium K23_9]